MMPAVLSLSATEIEHSPPKKSLPFSNFLLIALGSPPLNNQSTDTFLLSHFSTHLITPPLTHYHLFLCLPLSFSSHPRLTAPRLIRYHLFLCLPLSPFPLPPFALTAPHLTRYHLLLCLPLSLFPPPPAYVTQPLL